MQDHKIRVFWITPINKAVKIFDEKIQEKKHLL